MLEYIAMLEGAWRAITLGHGVVQKLAALRKDVESLRAGGDRARSRTARLEAIDQRMGYLELLAKEHDDRLQKVEDSLKDAVAATEAVAARAGTLFWMAFAGCALGAPALVIALFAFLRR
jgi:hypothetical protein